MHIVHGLDINHDTLKKEFFDQFGRKIKHLSSDQQQQLLEMVHQLDDDIVIGTERGDVIRTFGGDDTVKLGDGDDVADGGQGNDTLYGGLGNDTLIGGSGNDRLEGGGGDDVYVFEKDWGRDVISDTLGKNQIKFKGVDSDSLHLFRSGDSLIIKQRDTDDEIRVDYQFSNNKDTTDVKQIHSIAFDDVVWDAKVIKQKAVIGTDDDNVIYGFYDDDVMLGAKGNDTLYGGLGNDTLIGGSGNDRLEGGGGDDVYVFEKDWGRDVISDTLGKNQIRLEGLNPTDIYLDRDETHLIVKQLNSEDSIKIQYQFHKSSSQDPISEILFDDGTLWDSSVFRAYTVIGTQADDVRYGFNETDIMYGKDGDDALYGHFGDDALHGGLGADHLIGGAGNDTYYINEMGDEVIENTDEGEDVVLSEISYTLTHNVENITLADNTKAITATGNALNNIIIGNAINNTLDGKGGIDTMVGGIGDDTYHVDHSQDNVIEKSGEGRDSIIASSDYTLSKHVENLTLVSEAIVGIGNDLSNIITGNVHANHLEGGLGADTLDGGLGADIMYGGVGDDVYHVDHDLDKVVELLDEGYDTVISRTNHTLAKHVEKLILETDSDAIYAIGNDLNNEIVGNWGNNIIDGGLGADFMKGGFGDDHYIVDNVSDDIFEQIDSGIDTAEQYIDRPFYNHDEMGNLIDSGSYHLLFDNVENLVLKGGATKAFGNYLDNIITLNDKDNFVNALWGNDTLIYQKGGGRDVVLSADSIENKDTLVIDGYDVSEAIFVRTRNTAGSHDMLQIRFKGTNDQITLIDYFAEQVDGFDNRMDEITFTKGDHVTTLSQSEFEAKIFVQTNNHIPQVNKYPKPIKAETGKALSITFDKDTIKDMDAYDHDLSYHLTLASKGVDGRHEPLPNWLSFNPSTLTLTGTPPKGAVGDLRFILWGKDSFNYSAGVYVNLSIANPATDKPASIASPTVIDDIVRDTQGNDTLRGTTADNTFVYTKGVDTIIDMGGNDTLVFGGGITFNQVGSRLVMSGSDLILSVDGGTANQVTLKDFFGNADSVIETIKFETGGQIDYKKIYELFGKQAPSASRESALMPASSSSKDNILSAISKTNSMVGSDHANDLDSIDNYDQPQGLESSDILRDKAGNNTFIEGDNRKKPIGDAGDNLHHFIENLGENTITNVNADSDYSNRYVNGIYLDQTGGDLNKADHNLILKVSKGGDALTLKDFFLEKDDADIHTDFADNGDSVNLSQLSSLSGSHKITNRADVSEFDKALLHSLVSVEELKTLGTESNTAVI